LRAAAGRDSPACVGRRAPDNAADSDYHRSRWRNAALAWPEGAMKMLAPMLLAGALLAGCASVATPQVDASLFAEAKFEPPAAPIDATQVMALSPEMKAYLAGNVSGRFLAHGRT